jgi:prepilin peptidase CpaA
MTDIITNLAQNWVFWFVSIFCVVAAYIDGKELRVPNKLTFPMIFGGWIWSSISYGMAGEGWYIGLMWSLAGTAVGLMTLIPAMAIGGMGAGDVKMMAAIGAWVHCTITFYAFCLATVIGGVMAVAMILMSGQVRKHYNQFWLIFNEIVTIKNPDKLAEIAAERKPSMYLLPYGIPLAIGTILYFAWNRMLI